MFVIDCHADTITALIKEEEFLNSNNLQVSLEKLRSFENFLQFFAICLDTDENPYKDSVFAIDFFKEELEKNKNEIFLLENSKDLKDKRIKALLSLEGGEALEGKLENLYKFYTMGVRSITITWNRNNELCDSIKEKTPIGLTKFGKTVVKEMNKLGMIVDVSHISVKGFYDIAEISEKPFIASHSNAKKICSHPRNLDDEQLLIIKEKKGIVGLNLYAPFLSENKKADIYSILKHSEHILKVAGEDVLALGGDFDGMDEPAKGFENVSSYLSLYNEFKKAFGVKITNKVFSENCSRIIKEVI